ncbi:hypothetical protein Dda_9171 [Drechslerella dactyloides]|uniref:Uncharacterized protein n=1 Tax=Drechslerella dactyloides TaxID=74499 RepID=A0AAD6IPP4_DREDA|nr:hypothetical protein Dda_9171 [Drechslerella dactyloides]
MQEGSIEEQSRAEHGGQGSRQQERSSTAASTADSRVQQSAAECSEYLAESTASQPAGEHYPEPKLAAGWQAVMPLAGKKGGQLGTASRSELAGLQGGHRDKAAKQSCSTGRPMDGWMDGWAMRQLKHNGV